MNFEHALKDPASEFETPAAVLADGRLDAAQKRAILEQWKRDALQLESAAAENMAGGEPNLLHSVNVALRRLGDE